MRHTVQHRRSQLIAATVTVWRSRAGPEIDHLPTMGSGESRLADKGFTFWSGRRDCRGKHSGRIIPTIRDRSPLLVDSIPEVNDATDDIQPLASHPRRYREIKKRQQARQLLVAGVAG